jgi:hypothetical protein
MCKGHDLEGVVIVEEKHRNEHFDLEINDNTDGTILCYINEGGVRGCPDTELPVGGKVILALLDPVQKFRLFPKVCSNIQMKRVTNTAHPCDERGSKIGLRFVDGENKETGVGGIRRRT